MSSRATLKFLTTISLGSVLFSTIIPYVHAQSALPEVYRIKKSGQEPNATPPPVETETPLAESLSQTANIPSPSNLSAEEQALIYQWQELQSKPQKIRNNKVVDSSKFVNHEVLAKIYKKYVKKQGWVDYRGLKRDKEAQEMLKAYIEDMLALDPSTLEDPQDRLASWLNLYNALVIHEVLKQYPVKSLIEMKNFFGTPRIKLGDQAYNFVDIEKIIFREVIHDPRAVFARVHGASSGPRLLGVPYDAEKIDEQLDKQVWDFILKPENVHYVPKSKTLYLSQIFEWYADELMDVKGFLQGYLNKLPERYQIRYMGYNFGLNDEKLH